MFLEDKEMWVRIRLHNPSVDGEAAFERKQALCSFRRSLVSILKLPNFWMIFHSRLQAQRSSTVRSGDYGVD